MGAFPPPLVAGSAHRLAVDGDHPRRHASQRGHPGNEAALEMLGIKGGEDVADAIMRRRAIAEGAEPAQKLQFLVAKAGDVGKRFSPGQHRQ